MEYLSVTLRVTEVEEIGINAKVDVEVLRRGRKDTNSAPQQVIELKKIGYDINYRKYLKKYNDELDEFAVLVDRDMQTHSETNMLECIRHCKSNGYKCYIANPCFEFWLLMHLSDIDEEFGGQLDEIKENKKVSDQHTFVSKAVSDRAHHGKSGIDFVKNYMPYIDKAVGQAKMFSSDENELVDNIGCNLWKMIEELKLYGK